MTWDNSHDLYSSIIDLDSHSVIPSTTSTPVAVDFPRSRRIAVSDDQLHRSQAFRSTNLVVNRAFLTTPEASIPRPSHIPRPTSPNDVKLSLVNDLSGMPMEDMSNGPYIPPFPRHSLRTVVQPRNYRIFHSQGLRGYPGETKKKEEVSRKS